MRIALLSLAFIFQFTVSAQSFTSQMVEHDGFKHHIRIAGEGSPILLINGGPGMNCNGFDHIGSILAKNHTVILYDQRGTGLSVSEDLDSSDLTMEAMVEDIEAIRKHLGYEKWILMGQSFGGVLSYHYAVKYPERITAMIQSSSGGMDLEVRDKILVNERLTSDQRDSLTWFRERMTSNDDRYAEKYRMYLGCAYVYNDEFAPIIGERLAEANLDVNRLIWADLERIEFDVKEEMLTFQQPVLIIQGEYDMIDISIAELQHEILPDSRLVIVPESGHYGWLDNPDVYLSSIDQFLDELEEQQ
ncbi:alpha/beta fold hydrolase [Phaeocystidibacter luteus]|uniref:Alpha/beta fold hydrolase n=1 Tax=Phaeocystidibacter luteus TaxID=911197 RepID=A0A6N6RKX7_9FLAO|nr:alpha/beta hydrolase [Phaeocystidibacter luteus]KAB2814049.1 alpha/beta fold hydrolase [Phaeocystidibacter luteus]